MGVRPRGSGERDRRGGLSHACNTLSAVRGRAGRRGPDLDGGRSPAAARCAAVTRGRARLLRRGAGSARLRDGGGRVQSGDTRVTRAVRSGAGAGAPGCRASRSGRELHPGPAQRGDPRRPPAQQRHPDPVVPLVRHPGAAGARGAAGGDGPAAPVPGSPAGRRRRGQGGLLRPRVRRRRARPRRRGAVAARALRDPGQRPLRHRSGAAAGGDPAAGGDHARHRPPAPARPSARDPRGAPQHPARPARGGAGAGGGAAGAAPRCRGPRRALPPRRQATATSCGRRARSSRAANGPWSSRRRTRGRASPRAWE